MTLARSTGKFSHKPCVAFEGLSGAETLPAGLLLTWWNRQRGERSQGQVKPEARKREEQSSSVFVMPPSIKALCAGEPGLLSEVVLSLRAAHSRDYCLSYITSPFFHLCFSKRSL